jgi:hypothetical protein
LSAADLAPRRELLPERVDVSPVAEAVCDVPCFDFALRFFLPVVAVLSLMLELDVADGFDDWPALPPIAAARPPVVCGFLGAIAPVALLSCCELALGVAVLWPETAPPDDIEPDGLLLVWPLVALLSRVLLVFGVEVCASAGSAAAIRAAKATLPRSFFIELFLSWLAGFPVLKNLRVYRLENGCGAPAFRPAVQERSRPATVA